MHYETTTVAALEDKVVQHAVGTVLNQIWEEDFLGFSYGFRPGRSQHDALDALYAGITRKKVNWVLDLDVRSFFDKVDHDGMIRFVEHRIGDRRIIRIDPISRSQKPFCQGERGASADRCKLRP